MNRLRFVLHFVGGFVITWCVAAFTMRVLGLAEGEPGLAFFCVLIGSLLGGWGYARVSAMRQPSRAAPRGFDVVEQRDSAERHD